jgi:D-alanyl-D-alanine endopeptidase (penicillin-binding protein 7)
MIKSALAIFTSLLFIHAGLAPAAAQTVNNAAKKAPKKVVAKRPAQAVSKTVAKGS